MPSTSPHAERQPKGPVLVGALAVEFFAWRPWLLAAAALVMANTQGALGSMVWLVQAVTLALGAYALSSLRRRGLALQPLRLALLALGLLAATTGAALAPYARALAFFSLLFLWWRGLIVAQYYANHDLLTAAFTRLVLWQLAAVALASTVNALPSPALTSAAASVAGLFAIGLVTLAASRLMAVRQEDVFDARTQTGTWRPAVVGMVVLLTALLLILLRVLAGPAFPSLQARFLSLVSQLMALLERLLEPLALLIGKAIEPVVRFLAAHAHPLVIQPGQGANGLADTAQHEGGTLPAALLYALRLLAYVTAAAVVALVFFGSIFRAFRLEENDVPEEREALPAEEVERGQRTGKRRRGSAYGQDQTRLPFVRKAYRRFQAIAASLGIPRKPEETPDEFLERVRTLGLPASDQAAHLTAVYVRARYGPVGAQPEDNAAVERLLNVIDKAARTGGKQRR